MSTLRELGLTDLELKVLSRILAQGSAIDGRIVEQLKRATILMRDRSCVGFFTYFTVPEDSVPIPVADGAYGDVSADLEGISHGAGFLLMIRRGRVEFLEGYTYADPWPEHEKIVRFWDHAVQ